VEQAALLWSAPGGTWPRYVTASGTDSLFLQFHPTVQSEL